MASRVFAVDLGAWSVKLAVASPGLRGATLLNVVERLVPPGDEPTDVRAKRVLSATGSLFVHLDAREVHYVKVLLDGLFGRASFMNEIIWAYDYGGRSKTKWAQKHDTILWYVKDPEHYTFRQSESDRLPYMAP